MTKEQAAHVAEEQAWRSMKYMNDREIREHPACPKNEKDIWTCRIAVRDFLHNELFKELMEREGNDRR